MTLLRNSLLIALLALPLVGCDSFGDNELTAGGTRLFPVQIDGRWGYINDRICFSPATSFRRNGWRIFCNIPRRSGWPGTRGIRAF